MYLSTRVGTPSAPADPDVLPSRAQKVFDFAVLSAACPTPIIAMNELFGAATPTPWTPTTARYRANVLEWARLLAARGGRPVLLVSSEPYTSGEAAQWWRDLAGVADIALEKYFNAPAVHKAGPVLGSRRMRTSMRRSAAKLFAIGVPPSRVGLVLGFQTRRGSGGREGLEPAGAWFEVAKLQALAAKQVARELGLAHVWSWGWAFFNEQAADPDKRERRASGCGRATGPSVMRQRSARPSIATCGPGRSTCRAAFVVRSGASRSRRTRSASSRG